MRSDELYDAFRSDVVDEALPYLWTEAEVWRYMDSAYRMFVRLTGGVTDELSVAVVTGEPTAEISPLILKFREAVLDSTGRKLRIVNHTDEPLVADTDYGMIRASYVNRTAGPVTHMVIGNLRNRKRGVVTWIQVPQEDDAVTVSVYRLPLERITKAAQEFDDVGEEHHESLLLWMKHLAYGKQDAETFDRGRRDDYKAEFEAYCAFSKSEGERYKSKVRVVEYGGL